MQKNKCWRCAAALAVLMCVQLLLGGCAIEELLADSRPVGYRQEQSAAQTDAVRVAANFSVIKEAGAEADTYRICYKESDGSETKVVDLGFEAQQLIFSQDKIFYWDGRLVSVDFWGKNPSYFSLPEETGLTVGKISFMSGDWLYCSAEPAVGEAQSAEPAPGVRVRTDFSTWEKLDGKTESTK